MSDLLVIIIFAPAILMLCIGFVHFLFDKAGVKSSDCSDRVGWMENVRRFTQQDTK